MLSRGTATICMRSRLGIKTNSSPFLLVLLTPTIVSDYGCNRGTRALSDLSYLLLNRPRSSKAAYLDSVLLHQRAIADADMRLSLFVLAARVSRTCRPCIPFPPEGSSMRLIPMPFHSDVLETEEGRDTTAGFDQLEADRWSLRGMASSPSRGDVEPK